MPRVCAQPEEYDEASSVLICNFPGSVSAAACRNFCGWFGAVVRVERTSSVSGEANFVVVFSNPEPAAVSCSLIYSSYFGFIC